jgi:hypothetical protein
MSTSSIGRGPAYGGNENHDGDPTNKTLGEKVQQEPPAGNDAVGNDAGSETVTDEASKKTGTEVEPSKPPN